MDHALRTISYIADIGELVVIMARRRILPQDGEEPQVIGTTPKMICHVFESEEVRMDIENSEVHSPLLLLLEIMLLLCQLSYAIK